MAHRDRFGRDKASQRRQKIRQPAAPPPQPTIVLKRGDAVRWDGHQGAVQRITEDMAEIAESSTGRLWRLPVSILARL